MHHATELGRGTCKHIEGAVSTFPLAPRAQADDRRGRSHIDGFMPKSDRRLLVC